MDFPGTLRAEVRAQHAVSFDSTRLSISDILAGLASPDPHTSNLCVIRWGKEMKGLKKKKKERKKERKRKKIQIEVETEERKGRESGESFCWNGK